MTDKKTEALKLALDALENSRSLEPVDVQWVKGKRHAAITAIREALAEQPAIPQGDIAMPRSIEEAEAMEKFGYAYLQQHAPEMLKEQPAQQQEPYGWKIYGVNSLFVGEFAEADAKDEAKRIGGTCIAFPLYTSTPASKPWVGLDDADLDVCDTDGRLLARYWERVLREKNT